MRRADLIAAVVLFALAGGYVTVALDYPYTSNSGPGSGLLPVWLGIAMGVLSVLLFVNAWRAAPGGDAWLPDRAGLIRLLITFSAAVIFVSLLKVVGMVLGCALFLLATLRLSEGYSWRFSVVMAVCIGAGIHLLFIRWLRVPFPVSFLGF